MTVGGIKVFALAGWGGVLLLGFNFGSAHAGDRVQFSGSTSIQLPTPTRSVDDLRNIRVKDAPSGESEYESGAPIMPVNRNPKLDKKLKQLLDREKNWIFMDPHKMQFDSKTEEFLKGEKATGLFDHRLMKDEDKSIMEKYLEEKSPEREKDVEQSPGDRNSQPSQTELAKARENEALSAADNPNVVKMQEPLLLFSTDQKNPALFGSSTIGPASLFDQRSERISFGAGPGAGTLQQPDSREDLRKERDARDAAITKMLQPRSFAPGAGSRLEPAGAGLGGTRLEAGPGGSARTESFLAPGAGRPQPVVGGISAGANAPLFSGGATPSSLPPRGASFDFGAKPGFSSAPSSGFGSISAPASAPKPTVTQPFVLPLPTRKF